MSHKVPQPEINPQATNKHNTRRDIMSPATGQASHQ